MTGHARLAASQTKQWATCPGSAAWMEAHPELEGPSGEYAQMGTCAHALVERCLREGSEPAKYLDRLIEIIDPEGEEKTSILKDGAKMPASTSRVIFIVDQDMVEAVTHMTDYVRMRCIELGLVDPFSDKAELAALVATLVKGGTVRLESYVTPLPDRDDTGGTADVIIDAWPDVLEAIDYKNGSGVFVPVEGNHQLRSYMLGTLREAGADDYGVVRYTICQPRHVQSPPNGIMWEETVPAELLEWGVWLSERAEIVDEARAAVAAGADLDDLFAGTYLSVGEDGSHCTFCDLLADCPAALAKAQEQAGADFTDVADEIEPPTGPNHLAMVLPWVPFLNKWLSAAVAAGETLLLAGGEIAGFKIVHGKSTRKMKANVTDKKLMAYLKKRGVTSRDDMFNPSSIRTGPQLEKLLPANERKAFSEEFMEKPPGRLIVVPESDPKPAVTVNVGDDFDELED